MVVEAKSSFWEHIREMITCLDQSITDITLLLSIKPGRDGSPGLKNYTRISQTILHRPTLYYFTIFNQLLVPYTRRRHSRADRRVDCVDLLFTTRKVCVDSQFGLARCLTQAMNLKIPCSSTSHVLINQDIDSRKFRAQHCRRERSLYGRNLAFPGIVFL